jgi:hypothetical protein
MILVGDVQFAGWQGRPPERTLARREEVVNDEIFGTVDKSDVESLRWWCAAMHPPKAAPPNVAHYQLRSEWKRRRAQNGAAGIHDHSRSLRM